MKYLIIADFYTAVESESGAHCLVALRAKDLKNLVVISLT